MKRIAALIALLLAVSPARALAPVTIETDWNQKTVSFSTVGVSAYTFDVGGFGGSGYAILGGTYTANGVDGTVLGSTAPITSATTNVVGFDYSIYAGAGQVSYKIAQTLKTPPLNTSIANSSAFNNPSPASMYFTAPTISTSSAIVLPGGVLYSKEFRAKVTNPVFYFTGLTTTSTLYFMINYGVPKLQ